MTSLRYDTVSFLSDYGYSDEFVGIVKSVIRSIAPQVTVLDITHEIPPYDVRAGALALARCAQYLCPGVVLAVVDPGVGTKRRPVAVEVGGGSSVLVGPDNGLLASAVAISGGADRAVVLNNPAYQLPRPAATFDGRDVFAPAAAHLACGVAIEELGDEVDPARLTPGMVPVSRNDEGEVTGEVLWIDRYGNVQLNVDPEDVDGWGERIHVRFGDQTRTVLRISAFGELSVGSIGLLADSYGLASLVVDRASAAEELGLAVGDEVILSLIPEHGDPEHREGDEASTSPVDFTRRPRR
ncbi:MAG: Adenosyl-chloride synthase [Acidimicrobiales bacterium]|nr:MAG: hypothetical protein EDR02_04385 [Actinomycetota bacterium]MBV6507513.1 Adenosyl-chloride synthase [Acidimicrobiales bacterium]RIK07888.1 MAG: hypothetical protein DCC48_02750 [Acidobacteriota bacterium]